MKPVVCYICLCLVAFAEGDCPFGWTQLDDFCLVALHDPVKWIEADIHCRSHNSYLVRVDTLAKNEYVQAFLRANVFNDSVWAGGTDELSESVWTWIGTFNPFTDFTDWGPKQPDNHNNNENCLTLSKSMGFRWADANCDLQLSYICERPRTTCNGS